MSLLSYDAFGTVYATKMFRHETEVFFMEQSKQFQLRQCVYEATLGCNLRCRHCGSRAGKPRNDELSTAEAADLFGQLAALGCKKITISGGEPMLRRDWAKLIESAAKTGMRVGMITNALSFDEEAARCAQANGLRAVGFSLDGTREVHDRIRGKVGHYERILRAMGVAAKIDLPFAIVTFVNDLNLGRLDDLYELIKEQGAFAWQVQLGANMGNMKDNQELLISERQLPAFHAKLASLIRRNDLRIDVGDCIGYYGPEERILRKTNGGKPFSGCGAGIRVVGIESNGNVKGCLSMMAGYNEAGQGYVEGNIREKSLEEIWTSEHAFAYNRQWSPDSMEGFCRDCEHVRNCRGGCRSNMIACGRGEQNPMCVYRVLSKQQKTANGAGKAAAVVFASLIGSQMSGCDIKSVDYYGMPLDGGEDAGPDNDTEKDTNDVAKYGLPDTGVDTSNVEKYGLPDTEDDDTSNVDYYGMPDTGNDTSNVDYYGIPDTEVIDTSDVDYYGIPDTEK